MERIKLFRWIIEEDDTKIRCRNKNKAGIFYKKSKNWTIFPNQSGRGVESFINEMIGDKSNELSN